MLHALALSHTLSAVLFVRSGASLKIQFRECLSKMKPTYIFGRRRNTQASSECKAKQTIQTFWALSQFHVNHIVNASNVY